MATLSQIRPALVATLRRTGWQVTGYPPAQVNPPAIFVGTRKGSFETQGGGMVTTWPVFAAVALTNPSHFERLDDLIDGPNSVLGAIEDNDDLGLDGVSAYVGDEWSEGDFEIGGQRLYGIRFDIEVRF